MIRPETLEAFFSAFADEVAARVVERLRAGEHAGLIDQAASSLGRRRHISAVRRRIAAGDRRAVQLGRRYLLAEDAHAEELRALAAAPKKRTRRAELLEELGLTDAANH